MNVITVLVVDDHPVVRQGLRSLLSQYDDIQVVGEAEGEAGVLAQVTELHPDVVLMDIRLDGPSGTMLAQRVRRIWPETRIIILTSYDDEGYLLEAARAGVHGYLLKGASAEVLADAIRAVYAGEKQLSPLLGGKALDQLAVLTRAQAQSESGLTNQELQLLRLIAAGTSTQEMGDTLHFSERTVKRKIQDILVKLGATSRAQAVAEAFKRGLL